MLVPLNFPDVATTTGSEPANIGVMTT